MRPGCTSSGTSRISSAACGRSTTSRWGSRRSPRWLLYGVVGVGMVLAGPAWVWVLPLALAGQCLVLVVYAELASEFPVANASYQWSRRLLGPTYGWVNGWVCLCAYAAANTTIAYLGAPWALTVGVEPSPARIVTTGAILITVCAVINALGIDTLKVVIAWGSLPRDRDRGHRALPAGTT